MPLQLPVDYVDYVTNELQKMNPNVARPVTNDELKQYSQLMTGFFGV